MEAKKDIVIIADFCSAFDGKGNNRFIYIAEHLVSLAHNVEIVTSDFFHGGKKPFDPIVTNYKGIKVTMLHEPPYYKNISVRRFLSHYSWGKKVHKYLKARKKPDVVYCAMPTLKAASLAGKYCNKNGIKFIVDVQDLWPEAFRMAFNIPVISSFLFFPFKLIANNAYKRANEVIAVSQTYVDRVMKVNKKAKEGHSVFLGTDLKTFDENANNGMKLDKPKKEIWLGYCGSLSASYNLPLVFDAMREYNNSNLKFVVMGDGPRRKEFEQCAKGLNVLFTGKLSYSDMCSVLCQCDIVVNPIIGNSVASIINKHGDYAAAGRPVLNTQESKEYKKLICEYNMGYNVIYDDSADLIVKLKLLCDTPSLREVMGNNSRRCAERLFDRATTYPTIITCLLDNTEETNEGFNY